MSVNTANQAPGTQAFASAPGQDAAGILDLKICGGCVVDGTGNERYQADIGVFGGRIVAIGDLSEQPARQTIDASGKLVAPGFIDVHGHDDLMFVERPGLEWKTTQGITSVVVGNCGVSGAPAPLPGIAAAALALLAALEQIRR